MIVIDLLIPVQPQKRTFQHAICKYLRRFFFLRQTVKGIIMSTHAQSDQASAYTSRYKSSYRRQCPLSFDVPCHDMIKKQVGTVAFGIRADFPAAPTWIPKYLSHCRRKSLSNNSLSKMILTTSSFVFCSRRQIVCSAFPPLLLNKSHSLYPNKKTQKYSLHSSVTWSENHYSCYQNSFSFHLLMTLRIIGLI
ncbi:hypothetical protein Exig_2617 [Exiguobacterium sibiricum 255-15]|uniref:Uncharacterized protein n=1 Tax=Exiguobacterium sibiricum (strain DSM 17290 / CCUG 55495 / CIP 109462 / JCM 13490 / 255-15) TaxID=262543 RepID=B1YMK6_EXIS2|nr:hypothetical protein Exig_2617 [Exiguobacterium sibiricum 255-15]